MAKEWSDDEISAEIKRCHDIVREDRERAQYTTLHERFGKTETDTETEGKPPPAKETGPEGDPKPKKRSIWWGETE
jgi:hypothetical protein